MKIWLINPYGPIPGEGWRDYRFTLLGRELACRGHSVCWWTGNFSHHFKRYRSISWQDLQITPDFQIRLVPSTGYSRNISLLRIRYETIFAWRMHRRAAAGPSPDLIVGTDPPQIVGYASLRLASRFHVPLVLDVFDLWPELFNLAFPQAFRFLAPMALFPLYQLRKHNLRGATALTALCYTYLQSAIRVAPVLRKKPTLIVFNGIDLAAFRHLSQEDDGKVVLAANMGKRPGEVWAIFAGSLGNNYDIMALLNAASVLARRKSPIKIIIAGAGPLRERVIEFIERIRPNNLLFYGDLDNEQLIKLYGICDIGLCAYSPDSNVSMPDKAYDYMAAGLPIVNSLRGELESLLKNNTIGVQYSAGDSLSLASSLDSLAGHCQLRRVMAANSFQAASQFDSRIQYGNFSDFVEKIGRLHKSCDRCI